MGITGVADQPGEPIPGSPPKSFTIYSHGRRGSRTLSPALAEPVLSRHVRLTDIRLPSFFAFKPTEDRGIEPHSTREHTVFERVSARLSDLSSRNIIHPCRRWDSNPHNPASKTGAFASLATAAFAQNLTKLLFHRRGRGGRRGRQKRGNRGERLRRGEGRTKFIDPISIQTQLTATTCDFRY